MAKIFTFFAYVFTIKDYPCPKSNLMNKRGECFSTNRHKSQRRTIINKQNENKMAGPFKFYLRTMKEAKNEIFKALNAFFNKLLATGKVPDE